MPGNPHVRFDEGRVGRKMSPSLLLYRLRGELTTSHRLNSTPFVDT